MMSENEFYEWANDIHLREPARQFLTWVRKSDPSRSVQGRRSNMRGPFASRKMGLSLGFESELELAFLSVDELDDDVLEVWSQPCEINITYTLATGRRHGNHYHPDLCVLYRDRVEFLECKYATEFQKLLVAEPHKYHVDPDGTYRMPPAEEAFAEYGLSFRVVTDRDLSPKRVRNMEYLADYFRPDTPPVPDDLAAVLVARVQLDPGIRLATLLDTLSSSEDVDHLYRLIATGVLVVDLDSVILSDHAVVPVFSDVNYMAAYNLLTPVQQVAEPKAQIVLESNQPLVWDGRLWTIQNVGDTALYLVSPDDGRQYIELALDQVERLIATGRIEPPATRESASPYEIVRKANPKSVHDALQRWKIIRSVIQEEVPVNTLNRNQQRWVHAYRKAERQGYAGFSGLLSNSHRRGNRNTRVSERTRALIDQCLTEHYLDKKQLNLSVVYDVFVLKAKATGTPTVSDKTFYRVAKSLPVYDKLLARQGRRAANQEKPRNPSPRVLPPYSDYPWQLAYMDHTEVDVQMVSAITGKSLKKRAWLTLLLDASSRRILAAYLSFDPPSAVSCLMALRLCVQRYHRLPKNLVVDNGAEFDSVQFQTFLAWHGITAIHRPPGEPRYGSPGERIFGIANKQFFHLLLGNTQMMTKVRQVTKSVDPTRLAVWTFEQLLVFLEKWAFEVYDNIPHPAFALSPRERYDQGLRTGGERTHTHIVYDEAFRIFTLPTPKRQTQVRRDGIRILYFDYWTEVFRDPTFLGTTPPLRYDPFDITRAYAYVHDEWHRLFIPRDEEILAGRSEREIRAVTVELRERQRTQQLLRKKITGPMIAAFLAELEETETLLRQRQLDLERSPTAPSPMSVPLPEILDGDDDTKPLKPKGAFSA